MKKLVTLIVLGALTIGLLGCSGSDSAPKPGDEKPKEAPGAPKDGV